MSDNQITDISSVSWNWQPSGQVVASGSLTVARAGSASQPITLNFQIPAEAVPTKALADPRSWVLAQLRQALRSTKPVGTNRTRRRQETPSEA